jgi:hypothetical protein
MTDVQSEEQMSILNAPLPTTLDPASCLAYGYAVFVGSHAPTQPGTVLAVEEHAALIPANAGKAGPSASEPGLPGPLAWARDNSRKGLVF